MIEVLGALFPVFVLILAGWAIRRWQFVPDSFWPPAEKMTYYVFFPGLLTTNLANADMSGLPVLELAVILAGGTVLAALSMIALRRVIPVPGPSFTSMMQGTVRPNTYVGLAAAAGVYGPAGVTLTALGIAAVVPLVNLIAVLVHLRWVPAQASGGRALVLSVIKNPLILSCLVGIALNVAGIRLPGPVNSLLSVLGSAALPLGLLAVGAGLDIRALRGSSAAILSTSAIKLLALPLVVGLACWSIGVDAVSLGAAVLYAALPCSSSAYVLSRQMGGDAPLMAGIITATHLLAAFTLPLVLIVVAMT
ncbi:AEC family transporter [Telmatospirillum sp. J64-1]|uniref:AEC family transporter n=1 Tax=Telmatospirillum sp. J64-1 TaxID=2502183 RepID=UPI00115EC202|nr:AEC family transporter [Telmatospirillum sp. J64-1]